MEGIDRLLGELAAWSAEQRADEAARSRTVARSLRRQAMESATLAGTCVDLVETGAQVLVQIAGGHSVRGTAAGVGQDFLAVRGPRGLTLVPFPAVASVRPLDGSNRAASGDRRPRQRSLMQLLAVAAEDRPRVRVVSAGEAVVGDLVAVGEDVLSVRVEGGPPSTVYVPAASISEVSLG